MAEIFPVAHIYTEFPTKFGIPRQSGLAKTSGRIVFCPEFRSPEAVRGLEGYSHLWLIWEFSENKDKSASLTVRPPRLGGNVRMGVFATRSPFRPNPIGLSSVRLVEISENETDGKFLVVAGAEILDGTPIYDIKPYLKYTDSHPDAIGGFADGALSYKLTLEFPSELISKVPDADRATVTTLLENDPRPAYKNEPDREYGMKYSDYEIFFKVDGEVLTVTGVK